MQFQNMQLSYQPRYDADDYPVAKLLDAGEKKLLSIQNRDWSLSHHLQAQVSLVVASTKPLRTCLPDNVFKNRIPDASRRNPAFKVLIQCQSALTRSADTEESFV